MAVFHRVASPPSGGAFFIQRWWGGEVSKRLPGSGAWERSCVEECTAQRYGDFLPGDASKREKAHASSAPRFFWFFDFLTENWNWVAAHS
uniref:Uncharacterized protein n=1 Tax=Strigamia maritima TaxID=126957 RepID=T1JFJ9_STRMM